MELIGEYSGLVVCSLEVTDSIFKPATHHQVWQSEDRQLNTANKILKNKVISARLTFISNSLVVQRSESLTTNHEVPGSIPGSTVGIFREGEDSRGDHGLGSLVEFRFKGPPGITSTYITTHIIRTT